MNKFNKPMEDSVNFTKVYDDVVSIKRNMSTSKKKEGSVEGYDSPAILKEIKYWVLFNISMFDYYGSYYHKLLPLSLSVDEREVLKNCYVSGLNLEKSCYFFEILKSVKDANKTNVHYSKICPYCGIELIDTIDHILPRGKYPELSFFPNNLLLTCGTCNEKYKRTHIINSDNGERYFMNPYVDTFLDRDIIEFSFVVISDANMAAIRATVDIKTGSFNERENTIITNHFNKLNLFTRLEEKFQNETQELTKVLYEFNHHEIAALAKYYSIKYEVKTEQCEINNIEAIYFAKLCDQNFLLFLKEELLKSTFVKGA